MILLLSIFVLIVGLIMLINPCIWWQITESWKSYDATEPSDFYVKITRFEGGFFTLAGLGGISAFFFPIIIAKKSHSLNVITWHLYKTNF